MQGTVKGAMPYSTTVTSPAFFFNPSFPSDGSHHRVRFP